MAELESPFKPENRTRGTLLALLIIPLGVAAWLVVWSFSWVFGVIAAGVPIGAMGLYALGSGGRVSFNAAIRITIITLVTLPIMFFSGFIAVDPLFALAAAQHGLFFEAVYALMTLFDAASIQFPILFMVVSGASGLIAVYRVAAVQAKQVKTANVVINPYD